MQAKKFTKETITNIGVTTRDFPKFNIGDTIAVSFRIKEGDKERTQIFQGDVIARKNNGASSTFTIRKIGAHSIPVERIVPLYSPKIKEIKVIKHGDVRRAKLYYVRDRIGKAARVKELVLTKEQKEQKAATAQSHAQNEVAAETKQAAPVEQKAPKETEKDAAQKDEKQDTE